mmetsp:Transcript_35532/g.83211  ORF Transcript_35532/g.83211 Transcript_35532/m.83211 type:complete len:343 (-) Transcript_35532:69-1097(-)
MVSYGACEAGEGAAFVAAAASSRSASRRGGALARSSAALAISAVVAVALTATVGRMGEWGFANRAVRRGELLGFGYQDRDIQDVYNSHTGDVEEREEMRHEGSFRMTAADFRHESKQKQKMDHFIPAGEHAGVGGGAGGPVSTSDVPEGTEGAWYSDWWKRMRLGEVVGEGEKIMGLRQKANGDKQLYDAGINVDGWEPGRDKEQIMRDERKGHTVPRGFWKFDGSPAYEADMEVHHPCGSPLRVRPCDENVNATQLPPKKYDGPAQEDRIDGGWNPSTGNVTGQLWHDPWPKEKLLEEHHRIMREKELENERRYNESLADGRGGDDDGDDGEAGAEGEGEQ